MRELPEPDLGIPAYTKELVLSIQKQAYEDGLRDASKDAARYQWLRLALSDRSSKGRSHWFCSIKPGEPEELDSSIDEAMLTASQKRDE